MRLSQEQIKLVTRTISDAVDGPLEVYLFGSRLDDSAKGGDVDILIESDQPLSLIRKAQLKMKLESSLGLPVDIIAKVRNSPATPFQIIARAHSARLEIST